MSDHATIRSATGQFLPGRSGNPAGRPLGSRNRTSLWLDLLDEGEDEAIVRAVIDRALAGDRAALRACFDRLLPKPKDAPVELDLPEIASVADIATASSVVIAAVAAGELTPNEGEKVMKLLLAQMKILGMAERGDRARGEARTANRAGAARTAAAPPSPAAANDREARDGREASPSAPAVPPAAAACISPVPAAATVDAPAPAASRADPTGDRLSVPSFDERAAKLDPAVARSALPVRSVIDAPIRNRDGCDGAPVAPPVRRAAAGEACISPVPAAATRPLVALAPAWAAQTRPLPACIAPVSASALHAATPTSALFARFLPAPRADFGRSPAAPSRATAP